MDNKPARIPVSSQSNLNKIISYLLKGLVFVTPIAGTIYILVIAVRWIDGLIPLGIPGLSLLFVISFVIIIGYLGNTFVANPILDFIERALRRIPLINFIYSSINDLISAFFGENKKFDQPVLVSFDKDGILFKPGFITGNDFTHIGKEGKIAVYFPHSYNFSGNLFIVDSKYVSKLDGNTSDVMKYIVSGGVSGNLGKTN